MKKNKIIAIIPARMASSRFPGKPMKRIHNYTMIGHCYLRSVKSKLITDCYVATPDKEIKNYILNLGGKVVMTSHKHKMCNDRVFEAVDNLEKEKKIHYDIIVNIQGDLPMIYPDMVDNLIKPLVSNKEIKTSTMVDEVTNIKDFKDKNRVKVIFDKFNNAILLTREPVPSDFKFKNNFKKYKHVAIRAYKRDVFEKLKKLKMTEYEKIEGIDDLRLIENGIKINIVKTNRITETVDTYADLQKVKKMMKKDVFFNKNNY